MSCHGAGRRAPAADGDAVAMEDQRAIWDHGAPTPRPTAKRLLIGRSSAVSWLPRRTPALHARRGAVRGHVPAGRRHGRVRRVQPRLARCPPRALTRWCVARGGGAARCARRRRRSGARARGAPAPVRAAPFSRRRSGKPGTVSSQPQWTARVHMRWRA